jgi:hypothetical protein
MQMQSCCFSLIDRNPQSYVPVRGVTVASIALSE